MLVTSKSVGHIEIASRELPIRTLTGKLTINAPHGRRNFNIARCTVDPRLPMTEVFVYFTILRGLRSLPVRWTAIQALLAVLLEASNGWRGSQSDARNHA